MNMNSTHWITTTPQAWVAPEPYRSWDSPSFRLASLAAGFASISLSQMDAVALLDRIDTKYVLTTGRLADVLACLQDDYWMLEVNGQRLNRYRTVYFDTPHFDLYHAHVNERPERYKVRCREYVDSRQSFLEVKHRTRKDRTIKERIPTPRPVRRLTPALGDWLGDVAPLPGSDLELKLCNTFTRMTLVSKGDCERVTLDVDLCFSAQDRQVQLDGIVIAEVKMDVNHRTSPFIEQMRRHNVPQQGFSKYAYGVASLYGQVKKNAIKPKMLWVEKTMKGMAGHE
jgi:hypothetical protein